jgi:recombination protein RecA
MAKPIEEEEEKKPKVAPTLAAALASIQKMGIDVAGAGTDTKIENIKKFPSGLLCLDYILNGGLPSGRIIEMYGWESSGKTTMCLLIAAEVQRLGGLVALVDAEHAHDPAYAANLGVDVEKMITMQPYGGEDALRAVEKLTSTGKVQLIIIDSVASLVPECEIEAEMGKQFVGTQARMMSQALRKLTAIAAQTKTTLIFINQLRNKVGVVYGNPETTPGGLALKFYASLRFKVNKKAKIKDKADKVIGHIIEVKVDKSKVSEANLSTDFQLLNGGKGLNLVADTVDAAIAAGIITKAKTTYVYKDNEICIGYDKLVETLTANMDVYATIRKDVTDAIAALKSMPVKSIHSDTESKVEVTEKKTKK